MLIITKILLAVYYLAMNVYSFFLVKFQRDGFDEGECENAVHDGKIFISAILGGALGVYIAVFVFSYRKRSMFFMVLMPVLIVLNVYALYLGLTADLITGRNLNDISLPYPISE